MNRIKKPSLKTRIVKELLKRMEDSGSTRILMKSDNQLLDIEVTADGKYLVSFPKEEKHHWMARKFGRMDEIAVFLMNDGWKQYRRSRTA